MQEIEWDGPEGDPRRRKTWSRDGKKQQKRTEKGAHLGPCNEEISWKKPSSLSISHSIR